MRDKIRLSFTCSGCFVWLLVGGVLLVLLSNTYAWGRLLWAERQAAALARDLGYMPDLFVRSGVGVADISIDGSARCGAEFAYATPLDLASFRTHLLEVEPEANPNGPLRYSDFWFLPDASVSYYAGSQIPQYYVFMQPQYNQVVEIYVEAGRFPIWVNC